MILSGVRLLLPRKLFVVLVALLVVVVASYAFVLALIAQKSTVDTKVKSDVIMVLGGHVFSGTSCTGPICDKPGFVKVSRPNPCVVGRVAQAVSLYKEGYAPKILMSGGDDEEIHANEAETMKKWAVEADVPEEHILTETKSTSTYENFVLSKKIFEGAQLYSVLVVTEPYHIARAGFVATKLGYTYSVSPAVNKECWNSDYFFANWKFVKRESLALIGYKLSGKI